MPQGAKGAFPERGHGRANERAGGAFPERGHGRAKTLPDLCCAQRNYGATQRVAQSRPARLRRDASASQSSFDAHATVRGIPIIQEPR